MAGIKGSTRWVIVSDGSTDCTDEIVTRYLSQYSFITLLRIPSDGVRSFASKAGAFRAGLAELSGISYDFIGNLDADVCIDPDYCEKVLRMFEEDKKLGIAGGVIHDFYGGKFRKLFISPWSVGGPIHLFRRECYDHIGGYIPSRYGGVDLIAEIMARQKGWEVRAFPGLKVYHLRRTGTEKGHILYARLRQGLMESSLCYHPLFEFVKAVYRISEGPYFIGSLFRLFGYFWGSISGIDKVLPLDTAAFLRS